MKILIGTDYHTTYTFDKVAKTITLGNIPYPPKLEELLLITDVTNNTIIYNFADPTKGATISGNTITLIYDTNTGLFDNDDKLQIYYYLGQPQGVAIEDVSILLKKLLQEIRNPITVNPAGQLRVTAEGGTLLSVSSVGSMGGVNQIGGVRPIEDTQAQMMNLIWHNNIRTKIN
jgi:hypothetical protein